MEANTTNTMALKIAGGSRVNNSPSDYKAVAEGKHPNSQQVKAFVNAGVEMSRALNVIAQISPDPDPKKALELVAQARALMTRWMFRA